MVTATGLPGIAAVIALIFTFTTVQQADDTLRVSEQGQITDRYNDAVTNLGSDTVDQRLGGIYALQRIMTDSTRDQPTVVRVLSAFVRVHASASDRTRGRARNGEAPPDITAALNVLCTRANGPHDTAPVDLHGTDLRQANLGIEAESGHSAGCLPDISNGDPIGADFTGADLTSADLTSASLIGTKLTNASLHGADLTRANLNVADLSGADLGGANLTRTNLARAVLYSADFYKADLTDAFLWGADLTRADLRYANFNGANLKGADLKDAYLQGADLKKARGLTLSQVVSAHPGPSTKLPADLASDPKVLARIAAVGAVG
ncbi:pentapeptide repeat-containing protein [Streptomyces sp. NBC_01262]|uniref:pentapeptide repeat-containing protein n=1 Tax=Streptomyces sp. NBC_01262 TaxID=2903803 RepID=UPI002E316DBC|nr:pentapeptide repeat-containing protein [Streptomyces sp. NBC_01262]